MQNPAGENKTKQSQATHSQVTQNLAIENHPTGNHAWADFELENRAPAHQETAVWFSEHEGKIFDSLVIGAGQAGLSAAFELQRQKIDFVVLDANSGPGGAWQHRWDSLTMNDVHGVADLPKSHAPAVSDAESNRVIPQYFGEYEAQNHLPVLHGVQVLSVKNQPVEEGSDSLELLSVSTPFGSLLTRTLVNATGTWTRPFIPHVAGMENFQGEQFHTSNYPGPAHLAGKRVVVVGGGASAVQFIGELARASELIWVTRREPQWIEGAFDGLKAVEWVEERAVQGSAPASVVSSTGLFLRPQEQYAASTGIYQQRKPMFDALEEHGVRWADGSFESADAIIWATGFRPATKHLSPLHLHSEHGGVALVRIPGDVQGATTAAADPRVQLVGYGPSASTIGARHAARQAARAVKKIVNP
ncbi:MAG: NAD(P)-binding domain-containing protein [Rothia sp. (in: high G+C Gram-positive bacteria)]|nr:NAD(P)-binding domain-containing protein [Rothia sp. (in: high G+C Gram-positive bacteria)]